MNKTYSDEKFQISAFQQFIDFGGKSLIPENAKADLTKSGFNCFNGLSNSISEVNAEALFFNDTK